MCYNYYNSEVSMKIDIKQTKVAKINSFDIFYDTNYTYNALVPWSSYHKEELKGVIELHDQDANLKYTTTSNLVINDKEQFLENKILPKNTKEFSQLIIIGKRNKKLAYIYIPRDKVFNTYYYLKIDTNLLTSSYHSDSCFRHICFYQDNEQVCEILKPNVEHAGKNNYKIYLLDKYQDYSDYLVMFCLYLESLLTASAYTYRVSDTYKPENNKKINKYDKTWIISNFNDQEYLNDIEKEVKKSKEDFKKEIKPLLIIFAIGFISLFILFLIIFYFVRF
jgi:hypothetical protein